MLVAGSRLATVSRDPKGTPEGERGALEPGGGARGPPLPWGNTCGARLTAADRGQPEVPESGVTPLSCWRDQRLNDMRTSKIQLRSEQGEGRRSGAYRQLGVQSWTLDVPMTCSFGCGKPRAKGASHTGLLRHTRSPICGLGIAVLSHPAAGDDRRAARRLQVQPGGVQFAVLRVVIRNSAVIAHQRG